MKNSLDLPVVAFILENYPEEAPFLEEADREATFRDLLECLNSHEDVYERFGFTDSQDREYAFEGLVGALNVQGVAVTYEDVYQTWLDFQPYVQCRVDSEQEWAPISNARRSGEKSVITVLDYYLQARSVSPGEAKKMTLAMIDRMGSWEPTQYGIGGPWGENESLLKDIIERLG